MKKIFISSTYQDLRPHRRMVWDLLKTYEVEVKGMEEFGARTAKPLQTCLDEVAESDIFIGVIGMRYGSIDKDTNKSFTQREYELAVAKRKEILIYLFNEKEGKIAPSLIDFKYYSKLQKFKKLLQDNHTVDTFESESVLVEKIEKKLDQIFVNKSSQIFRPEKIDCTVHRFNIQDKKWMAFVGLLFGRPIEIYTGDADNFWVPAWVQKGLIIKTSPDNVNDRYDFQFEDRQGYKITIEGLSRSFLKSISKANMMMTKLLMNDTKIDLVLEIIKDFPFRDIPDTGEYYEGVKSALSNLPSDPKIN